MNKELYEKLVDLLETEGADILQNENNIDLKFSKMNTIFNLKKILDNYEELEQVLANFFKEKSQREKIERNREDYEKNI